LEKSFLYVIFASTNKNNIIMDYKFYIAERHENYLMVSYDPNMSDMTRMDMEDVNRNYVIDGDIIVPNKKMRKKMEKISVIMNRAVTIFIFCNIMKEGDERNEMMKELDKQVKKISMITGKSNMFTMNTIKEYALELARNNK